MRIPVRQKKNMLRRLKRNMRNGKEVPNCLFLVLESAVWCKLQQLDVLFLMESASLGIDSLQTRRLIKRRCAVCECLLRAMGTTREGHRHTETKSRLLELSD